MSQLVSERLTNTDCDKRGPDIGFIGGSSLAIGDRLFRQIDYKQVELFMLYHPILTSFVSVTYTNYRNQSQFCPISIPKDLLQYYVVLVVKIIIKTVVCVIAQQQIEALQKIIKVLRWKSGCWMLCKNLASGMTRSGSDS